MTSLPFLRAVLLVMAGSLSASADDLIRVRGSDALGAKLMPTLCELYREKNPGVAFDIAAEGSTTAFTTLLNGTADIGMSGREARKEELERFEKGQVRLVRITAAIDSLAIVVNPDNPIAELTRRQVEDIFTGDLKNWLEVGGTAAPFSIYVRSAASGAFSDFKDRAMSRRDYAKSAVRVSSGDSPVTLIENDRFGITYLGCAYANQPGIKPLMIDGCGMLDPLYAYRRLLFYFVRDGARSSVHDFIRWATHSPEALAVVSRLGFIAPGK